MEIKITYNDPVQVESLKELKGFTFIDSLSKKGKKEAWKLKNYWGAKLDPFALVLEEDKPIKAFYSEACNVVESLKQYLNER